jgi:hypothetical protein
MKDFSQALVGLLIAESDASPGRHWRLEHFPDGVEYRVDFAVVLPVLFF